MAGLQLIAKTRSALAALNTAMEGREIRKGYVALVSGKLQVGRKLMQMLIAVMR